MRTKGRGFYSGGFNQYTNPSDILKNICNAELNLNEAEECNNEEFSIAKSAHNSWSLAFSVKDKINSKKLIEEICSNTKMLPRIDSENRLGIITIQDTYSDSGNYHFIDSRSIIKYKFSRTKVDNVKSKVKVHFDMDYARGTLKKSTHWFSAKDFLGGEDYRFPEGESYWGFQNEKGYRCSYFNIPEDESDSELIFEAKYIRDLNTAEKLQKFLAMWYCQQHTIIDVDLTLDYISLEVGDIVYFDKLIGDVKAYGEDYTAKAWRNGQMIYPLFLVQAVSKNVKKVSASLIQLHKLDKNFSFGVGDINRDGVVDVDDLELLEEYVNTKSDKFTKDQLLNMDVFEDKSINEKDVNKLAIMIGE